MNKTELEDAQVAQRLAQCPSCKVHPHKQACCWECEKARIETARQQGAEHAILHDDMERNAMIETINELEKERDELRGGYNAGLLKAIEIAKAQKVGTAEIGDDWGQGQDSMADQIVAALETARGGVTPPPTQPGWKPDSLANETQKLEEK